MEEFFHDPGTEWITLTNIPSIFFLSFLFLLLLCEINNIWGEQCQKCVSLLFKHEKGLLIGSNLAPLLDKHMEGTLKDKSEFAGLVFALHSVTLTSICFY